MSKQIKEVMSHLGAQGTGQAKVRGDSAYYSKISKMRKKMKGKNNGHIV